jgi:DNA-cytosine methyltransferase
MSELKPKIAIKLNKNKLLLKNKITLKSSNDMLLNPSNDMLLNSNGKIILKKSDKIISTSQSDKLRVLDLFCGCGGMSTGIEKAGCDIFAGIDVWDRAIETYHLNHPDHLAICADLTQLPPEKFEEKYNPQHLPIDLLVGGPPCQGMSMAGKRDSKDPRNSLFMEYVKYLNFYNPRAFIMENVIGMLSMKTATGEKVIDIVMSQFQINYNCIICRLMASDFEVPQNRRRLIIIGLRKDLNRTPTEPAIVSLQRMPVSQILLPIEQIPESYYLSVRAITGIAAKKEKMLAKKHGFGAQFLKFDKPSYTIPARYWKDGYDALVRYDDQKIRRLTELELQRIQSFPDTYQFCGSKREIIMQIGNAVACQFAYHLGLHAIQLLK